MEKQPAKPLTDEDQQRVFRIVDRLITAALAEDYELVEYELETHDDVTLAYVASTLLGGFVGYLTQFATAHGQNASDVWRRLLLEREMDEPS